MQSIQEKTRVFEEWLTNYAPKDLVHNDSNQILIADYLRLHFASVVSVTNLNAAVAHIPNLERLPQKSAQELAADILKDQRAKDIENAKRGEAKMHKDYLDSLEGHKPSTERPGAKKILDDQEDIAKVNKEINSYINRYTCNNRIGIDYAATDTRRAELRKIAAGFGNTIKEREAALKAVKQTYFSYPS
jgi:hypothetical protein